MAAASQTKRLLLVYCVLALLVGAIYLQTARFNFVNYDDASYVSQNPNVTAGISWRGIVWAFTHIHSQNWHPLTTVSHMLDCQLFGLWAGGHHLVNVALHLIAAILLCEFLRRATGKLWASVAVAAIFAVHPLHVESVAWISERKDVLSAVFFMLTLLAYLHYVRQPRWKGMAWVVLAYAGGLLTKPMLVTTPIVLLLLDYWPFQRRNIASLLLEKMPLFALTAASCVATLWAQKLAVGGVEQLPLGYRVSNAIISYLIYLRQTAWPAQLIPFYIHPEGTTGYWRPIVAAATLLAFTFLVLTLRGKYRYLLVGWLWYSTMLVPVIGLVQVGLQGHADRYTYLPQIGILIALVWTIGNLIERLRVPQIATAVVTICLACSLAYGTYRQAAHWHDTEALWSYTLTISPNNDVAHAGFAGIELVRGDLDEAIAHYRRSLSLRDGNAAAHHGLALALARQRKFDEAIAHWRKSLTIRPDDVEARNYLGSALATIGHEDEAIEQWQECLRWDPENSDAAGNLAWLFATSNNSEIRDPNKALIYAQRAASGPGGKTLNTYRVLAIAYAANGEFEKAIEAAKTAVAMAKTNGNWIIVNELNSYIELFKQRRPVRSELHLSPVRAIPPK